MINPAASASRTQRMNLKANRIIQAISETAMYRKNSKFQHPSSREASITQTPRSGKCASFWVLSFGDSLDVGCWNLELKFRGALSVRTEVCPRRHRSRDPSRAGLRGAGNAGGTR